MFTVVKVREGLAPGDYQDPGWYKHPAGTVAFDVEGSKLTRLGEPVREPQRGSGAPGEIELQVVKPKGSGHHH